MKWHRPARIAVFLMCSVMAGRAQQTRAECPFSPIPAPTGKFSVGTLVLPLQRLNGTGTSRRVQLWYPAEGSSSAEFAGYVPDPQALEVFRSVKFLDQPECVFENWGKLKTAARERAKPLSAKNKFPLIIISPGAGMPRSAYTAYAQQLASDGFVVATVDFGSYGFLVSGNKALEEGPKEDNAGSAEIAAEDWAAHISELLDEISGKRPAVDEMEQAILTIVDLTRIAAMGHSIGGTASILACEKDSRFRACINADGGLDFTRLAVAGIRGTALFLRSHPLYSAADLAKRHRTQEEFDKMGKKALAETQALFSKSGGEAWVLSIDGTGHMSYSDAPYTMPTTISRFGGTIIEPGRLFKIVIRLMETYMEHEFDPSKPFQPNEFPELKLQVSRRQGK
jgi:dienelactone hydrolase